jgi:predicted nucleic acid-binding protein
MQIDDTVPNYQMKKNRTKLYLDACCLNRPFDDQTQERVRLEAEAVKAILLRIGTGEWSWTGSEVLMFEIAQIPDPDLQLDVALMTNDVDETIAVGDQEQHRAMELRSLGFKDADAMHLAVAEKAQVDVFLTVDDAILRLAARNTAVLKVKVRNPLNWLAEVMES